MLGVIFKELLHYGTIVEDFERAFGRQLGRWRIFEYCGDRYLVIMVDGDVRRISKLRRGDD